MADSTQDLESLQKEIEDVCAELNLNILNKEEFFAYIEKLNQEANTVFIAGEYPENYFKDTYAI